MAKTRSIFSEYITRAVTMKTMKKELLRLVKAIVDDEDYSIETIVDAEKILRALKLLQLRKRSFSFKLQDILLSCPEEFRCPLSKELMTDPVILHSGQTYDRPYIQKWFKAGNRTCPQTRKVISPQTILTPNHLLREVIAEWCKNKGIEFSALVKKEEIMKSNRDNFHLLFEKMSSFAEQLEAAKELRLFTKMPSFHALFGEIVDAIPHLLNPLNKKLLAENPVVIPLLMKELRSENIETSNIALATLFNLSVLDSNKQLLGESGLLKLMFDLLEEGHPLAVKDVASLILSLCANKDNVDIAIGDGAIRVILKKIKTQSRANLDELLSVLAIFLAGTNLNAIDDLVKQHAVRLLLEFMWEFNYMSKDKPVIWESNCQRYKETCISILHGILMFDRTKCMLVSEEEHTCKTISKIAENGTPMAKRKAIAIKEILK
ncbi:RING-type E3 ubiquitin transferase [Quillaja saponaria]|uniref:RING-type E3 ubiquitin transferase n=1 Tax=Quillaja saponaria TaxID=32244 RepID=A0AAD7LPB4_QUISA|nr:RING-type E3 ubiquitin transferase [Quillaja saponaria]